MTKYLNSDNFYEDRGEEKGRLAYELGIILKNDATDGILNMLAAYQKILADNKRRNDWDAIHRRLLTLFKCGKFMPLEGPMIGVSLSIRNSDYFRQTARLFGRQRSVLATVEWLAGLWNTTFSHTGIWMGKTFEPVSRATVADLCGNHPAQMEAYHHSYTRVGRNFFRHPHNPTLLQMTGMPVLTHQWDLKDRPMNTEAQGFEGELLADNLDGERSIPYSKTGALFLANPGRSVVPEMNQKSVFQLNYRWPGLGPVYPMTRLVDELVQIDVGIFLGQLVMATRNYSLGRVRLSDAAEACEMDLGKGYSPSATESSFSKLFHEQTGAYGYQNNGFFLMVDPRLAYQVYADEAFPFLRPHVGEIGYCKLGYDRKPSSDGVAVSSVRGAQGGRLSHLGDWRSGWRQDRGLRKKFTTFSLEASPRDDDGDVQDMRREDESILQMLQRIQGEISRQTRHDDHLRHFEKLNRLFRSGVAPTVQDGLFQGQGNGFNVRFSVLEDRTWYGRKDPLIGFDYYHGATLNLHWGLPDGFRAPMAQEFEAAQIFPTAIAALLKDDRRHPNLLNMIWTAIARYVFPWSGKSFETISGRKLSTLLDESPDLAQRYPERVKALKRHLASRPHYDLVKRNADGRWEAPGAFAPHLANGSWDNGMTDADKSYWRDQAGRKWVYGQNLMDARIVPADAMMRSLDMNYRIPEMPLLELAECGPSPFVRSGYVFLGVAGQSSILPMNNGPERKKTVFQFQYRYPMIGGPVPIGECLDEIVEIAPGLYLGQLIYSTRPLRRFHSSIDASRFAYQLFGYFLLLDNDWEMHRQAIGLDVLQSRPTA